MASELPEELHKDLIEPFRELLRNLDGDPLESLRGLCTSLVTVLDKIKEGERHEV
jgi:hypothetical protein